MLKFVFLLSNWKKYINFTLKGFWFFENSQSMCAGKMWLTQGIEGQGAECMKSQNLSSLGYSSLNLTGQVKLHMFPQLLCSIPLEILNSPAQSSWILILRPPVLWFMARSSLSLQFWSCNMSVTCDTIPPTVKRHSLFKVHFRHSSTWHNICS